MNFIKFYFTHTHIYIITNFWKFVEINILIEDRLCNIKTQKLKNHEVKKYSYSIVLTKPVINIHKFQTTSETKPPDPTNSVVHYNFYFPAENVWIILTQFSNYASTLP